MNKTKVVFYGVCVGLSLIGLAFAISQTPARAATKQYCANVEGACRPLSDWAMMGLKECPKDWYSVPSCTNFGTVDPTPVPTDPPEPTPSPTPVPATFSSLEGPNISVSLPEGYRVEFECAPEQCALDAATPVWIMRGPWKIRIVKD